MGDDTPEHSTADADKLRSAIDELRAVRNLQSGHQSGGRLRMTSGPLAVQTKTADFTKTGPGVRPFARTAFLMPRP
jgi:hypothetical protein